MAKKNPMKVISIRKKSKKKKSKITKTREGTVLMALAKKIDYQLGKYAFIVGVLSAIIIAVIEVGDRNLNVLNQMWIFFVVLGIIIGLINITKKERNGFLLAVVALMVVGNLNFAELKLWSIGPFLNIFLLNLVMIFGPAALIVALESIYSLAKSR